MPRVPVLALVVVLAVAACRGASLRDEAADGDDFKLPPGLLVGAGTSAIQSEGAWNVSGKGESAADHVMHLGKLAALQFGDPHAHDRAANSYQMFREDVAKAAELKLKLYRFSMSWSRVLPTGDLNNVNEDGLKFYHNLTDEILAHGMTPMATLYHFDHPLTLETNDFKGWQDPRMADKFAEYAGLMFKEFNGKIKIWTTINEPNMYCVYFPTLFLMSGMYTKDDIDHFKCMRNTVMAHAKAYKIFKDNKYEGQVGATAILMPARPKTTKVEDVYAANVFNQLYAGSVLHPLVYGDFPDIHKELIPESKLPRFTDDEKALLKDSTDFIGFNVYFGMTVHYNSNTSEVNPMAHLPILGGLTEDMPFVFFEVTDVPPGNPLAMFSSITPDALRSGMLWAWQQYKKPIIVTENGFGDTTGMGIHDEQRSAYHSAFLRTMVQTIKEHSIDVKAYVVWSLIDCFEWSAGYDRPFGLVHVDYAGGTLARSLKDSSKFWIELADTGAVPYVAPVPDTTPSSASASSPASLGLLFGLLAIAARLY